MDRRQLGPAEFQRVRNQVGMARDALYEALTPGDDRGARQQATSLDIEAATRVRDRIADATLQILNLHRREQSLAPLPQHTPLYKLREIAERFGRSGIPC